MDLEERNRLVEAHMWLADRVALGFAAQLPAKFDLEDLKGDAYIGLIDAAEKFDESQGHKFSTYARFRIRGHVMDCIRERSWMPRLQLLRERQFDKAVESIVEREGNWSVEKVKKELIGSGIDEEIAKLIVRDGSQKVRMMGETLLTRVTGHKEKRGEGMPSPIEATEDPKDPASEFEEHEVVNGVLKRLNWRERFVISAIMRGNMTMQQIGDCIGVTESRVSQIKHQGRGKIKRLLSSLRDANRWPRRKPQMVSSRSVSPANRHVIEECEKWLAMTPEERWAPGPLQVTSKRDLQRADDRVIDQCRAWLDLRRAKR